MPRTSSQNVAQSGGASRRCATSVVALATAAAASPATMASSHAGGAGAQAGPGDEERYINRLQLRVLIPASDMTLWRWQRDPDVAFPAPVKLGADGWNYWWLPTIRAWMQRREDRSRSPVGPAAQP
jgi:predicted DNA-binding transcriptional regulator AlpA